ncbi:MAG: hypothetical protein C4520_03595 [Candidatus Abyssobacteria bacterium SURF_5]|uniref:Uncharacterized protein n=1 Tax=Abyssobacteria bacterium (strain SURF_5) TaxID=2093360 RepID=A0A3A4NW25_ABYX5|nr:MAG: hypothetical protein C4520_03595 [Candidatus Abyssubacteria bacterium SURF_5]
MTVKDWWKRRKLDKLRGVDALDHGIVKGEGIPLPERWKQKTEIRYWKRMPEKEAYEFYMSLPPVKETPRLRSVTEFRKWNSRRKQIIATAETEFRTRNGIPENVGLSQAEQNKLNEFAKQRVQQLIDQPGMII